MPIIMFSSDNSFTYRVLRGRYLIYFNLLFLHGNIYNNFIDFGVSNCLSIKFYFADMCFFL